MNYINYIELQNNSKVLRSVIFIWIMMVGTFVPSINAVVNYHNELPIISKIILFIQYSAIAFLYFSFDPIIIVINIFLLAFVIKKGIGYVKSEKLIL